MKTIADVAGTLQQQRLQREVPYDELAQAAGLTPLSVRRALHGQTDARITTVMSLADKLGLELVLVPKQLAATLEPTRAGAGARPLSRVEQLKLGTTAQFTSQLLPRGDAAQLKGNQDKPRVARRKGQTP